jgi:hypothetical protein
MVKYNASPGEKSKNVTTWLCCFATTPGKAGEGVRVTNLIIKIL